MEVIYNISIKASISNIEAGLLYKYLNMHPIEKHSVTEGYFALLFKEFEQKREFELTLNIESICSCIGALEDQDVNDQVENLLKKELLDRLYKWSDIIDSEQDAIAELENYYYLNSSDQFYKENGDFSFGNYFKFRNKISSNQNLVKQKVSTIKKIMQILNI